MFEHNYLKQITLEDIFKYGPENHNRKVFEQIVGFLRKDALVPFVGAGLSIPIYTSWSESLKWIATKKICNHQSQEYINKLIDAKDFLIAAEEIENIRTSINLSHDYAELYSPDILNKRIRDIRKMAVWLLPMLFTGITITTNLDRMLEFVYNEQGNKFIRTLLPGERPYVRNEVLSDPNSHDLLKLHGSIEEDGRVDYSKIVFTESAYNRNYTPGSELFVMLQKVYEKKTLLFLGCSLEKDRTLDILRNTIDFGESNFAIVNCKEEDIDKRIHDLGELGIRAILYPDGEFESVRVILEALLEIKNPKAYKQLQYPIGSLNNETRLEKINKRFYYDSYLYETVGREKEITELLSFINDAAQFRWWAITGPGGSGKSRLGLALTELLPSGWRYIHQDLSRKGLYLPEPYTNTLYIIDSFQAYIDDIGTWLKNMAESTHGYKIRILLIERDIGDWPERLMNSYLKGILSAEKSLYNNAFLHLKHMQNEEIVLLMDKYASAVIPLLDNSQKWIEGETGKQLLCILEKIDPEMERPLYALFLADAFLSGEELIYSNIQMLLTYLLRREETYLEARLRHFFHETCPDSILNAIQTLLCYATVINDASQSVLEKLAPKECELLGHAEHLPNATSLMARLGLGKNDTVFAIQPDILGEFYVMRWLQEKANSEQIRIFFIRIFETHQNNVFSRFDRDFLFMEQMFIDYTNAVNTSSKNWEWLLLDISKLPSKYYTQYADLLFLAVSCLQYSEASFLLIDQFNYILKKCRKKDRITNEIIKRILGKAKRGKDYLTCSWIKLVEAYIKMFPNHSQVTQKLADALNGFSTLQNTEIMVALDQLEMLDNKYPESKAYKNLYAYILSNLFQTRGVHEHTEIVNRFTLVARKYPTNKIIAEFYSKCLCDYIKEQNVCQAFSTINTLKKYTRNYPRVNKIKEYYAEGLLMFSLKQDIDKSNITIDELDKFSRTYSRNYTIRRFYAQSLVFLLSKQDIDKATETFLRLEKLWISHKRSKFTRILSDGFSDMRTGTKYGYNLTIIFMLLLSGIIFLLHKIFRLDEEAMLEHIHIHSRYEKYVSIDSIYAQGLFIFSYRQDMEKSLNLIDKIHNLATEWHRSRGYFYRQFRALEYISLFALLCRQKDNNTDTKVKNKLVALLRFDIPEEFGYWLIHRLYYRQHIPACFPDGYIDALLTVNMINKEAILPQFVIESLLIKSEQDNTDFVVSNCPLESSEIIKQLVILSQSSPNNRLDNYIISLGRRLIDGRKIYSVDGYSYWCIIELHTALQEPGFADSVARLLARLITNCSTDNIDILVRWLEIIIKKYPHNQDIAVEYAFSLSKLIEKQEKEVAGMALIRLESLAKEQNNPEITSVYEKANFTFARKQDT